uniref:Uncharacterized protein n=1 Tax=Panagrolaimus sp. PS1159 TaxID=55785 RepID=A0AC35GK68_9BILA
MFFIISVFYSRVIVFFVFFAGFSIFEAQINFMMDVFAPVEVTLPSLQHKHPVVIYDSKRFPGKSSEWFFHKENRVSGYNVYRCVRCKSVNEKSKRSGAGSIGVPARIYIQNEHFMNDPDYPYGDHICSFETNPECETSKANLDMRVNPERPICKYVKMLTFFEEDNGKYGHLDAETKRRAQTILNQVGNGFNARKRGLMLNYQLGRKKLLKRDKESAADESLDITAENEGADSSSANVKSELGQLPQQDDDLVDVERTDDTENKESPKPQKPIFIKTLESHDELQEQLRENVPKLPFAVRWQQQPPQEDDFVNNDDFDTPEEEDSTATFQQHVNELLNAFHNLSYYLPSDTTIHTSFCSDLEAVLQKYIPLQETSVAIEEEQSVADEE